MIKAKSAFGSFSIRNVAEAKEFYTNILGLSVKEQEGMGLEIALPDGGSFFAYPKENHEPATFTVLNLEVEDIDAAAEALASAGVRLERYEGFNQDEKGIARGAGAGMGPDIAWFKDPSGNIFSILNGKM